MTSNKYDIDETSLLADLKSGNHHAFTMVYNNYWRKLYGVAYQHLKSKQAAEDIVQEILSGLWHRRETLEIRSLEAYLATAVKYAVIRYIANQQVQQNAVSEIQPGPVYHEDPDFFMQLLQTEINRLPGKCKLVFMYSRNEGLSNKEIAGKMEVSEKAVEKQMTKALYKLRTKTRDFFHLLGLICLPFMIC